MSRRLLCLLFIVGCADLASIERLRCGNGLHEASGNEDCDGLPADSAYACGAPGTAAACRYQCADAPCPPDWTCGNDGVCRVGSGQLGSALVLPMSGVSLSVGDLDGDGFDDVVSKGPTSMAIAYGTDGQISTPVVRRQAAGRGAPTVGDIDGDGRAEIAVYTEAGLQIYAGRADRQVVMVPTPTRRPSGRPVFAQMARMDPDLGQVSLLVAWTEGDGWRLEVDAESVTLTGAPYDAETIERPLTAGSVDAGPLDLLVSLTRSNAIRLDRWTCQPGECVVETVATVEVPSALTVERAFLADIDADGAIDLVADVTRTGASHAVFISHNDGGFGPLAPQPEFSSLLMTRPGDRLPRQLRAVFDIDGDGRAEFVTNDQIIFRHGRLGLEALTFTEEPVDQVLAGDFDRDGELELVAGNDRDTLLIEVSVEHGLTYRPLSLPVVGLVMGDFDANGQADLAWRDAAGDAVFALMDVATDTFDERVLVADFDGAPISHLVATTPREAGRVRQVSTVHALGPGRHYALPGSRIEPPFSRLLHDSPGVGRAITVGRLFEGAQGVVVHQQRLARTVVHTLPGDALGARSLTEIEGSCAVEYSGWAPSLAVDFDGDGRDALLTISTAAPDEFSRLGLFRPEPADPVAETWRIHIAEVVDGAAACRWASAIESVSTPRSIRVVDLDRDGRDDIVVHLERVAGAGDLAMPDLAVWLGTDEGHREPRLFALAQPIVGMDVFRWGDGAPTLVVASPLELFDVHLVDGEIELTPRGRAPSGLQSIARADIDGDGLDDLLLKTGERLEARRQRVCTARAEWEGQCTRPAATAAPQSGR